jgi:hypothetical protein
VRFVDQGGAAFSVCKGSDSGHVSHRAATHRAFLFNAEHEVRDQTPALPANLHHFEQALEVRPGREDLAVLVATTEETLEGYDVLCSRFESFPGFTPHRTRKNRQLPLAMPQPAEKSAEVLESGRVAVRQDAVDFYRKPRFDGFNQRVSDPLVNRCTFRTARVEIWRMAIDGELQVDVSSCSQAFNSVSLV